MSKAVTGYLAEDDTFFFSKPEADGHDAEMDIRAYCSVHQLDAEKLFVHLEALADPIMRLYRAKEELNIPKVLNTFVSEDRADDDGREEGSQAVLE